MRERMDERLAQLKAEFEAGKARLEAMEADADKLRETLLRISGAIQVLNELAQADAGGDAPP